MNREQILTLFGGIAALTAAGFYLYPHAGEPRDVCGIKVAIPSAVRDGLGLQDPLQEDGSPATSTGLRFTSTACLPPIAFARYMLEVDAIAEIGQRGAWTATAGQCNLVRVRLERDVDVDGGVADAESIYQLCGAPPSAELFKRARDPVSGQSVEIIEVFPAYARPANQPAVSRARPPYPAVLRNRFRAAMRCRPDAGVCNERNPADGGWMTARYCVELAPGTFTGTGCELKPYGESSGMRVGATTAERNYTAPDSCKATCWPDEAEAPDAGQ